MDGSIVAVQVVDVVIFQGEKAKKNIKGRVALSDGVSKVTCMLPDKTFNSMVSVVFTSQSRPRTSRLTTTCGQIAFSKP